MEQENTKSKKKILYYVLAGVCALLLIAATVLTVYFVTASDAPVVEAPPVVDQDPNEPAGPSGDDPNTPSGPAEDDPNTPSGPSDNDPDEPTGGEAQYVSPVDFTTVVMEYADIYENKTLGWWYRHKALDFTASAGTEVRCMADGTVESVSISEETGNLIVVNHGDGLYTLYRFVEPVTGLKKGDAVSKGQKIGAVAEAYGSEAFAGEHLHFEVFMGPNNVDPTDYLKPVLSEK